MTEVEIEVVPEGLEIPVSAIFSISGNVLREDVKPLPGEKTTKITQL